MPNKIIAVYGNSYKTTTAINLAELLRRYTDTEIAVVSADSRQPFIPIALPQSTDKSSLGELMGKVEDIDENGLLFNAITAKPNIAVYGYNRGENINSYAAPTDSKIDDMYMLMRNIFNYTIVDCTSDIMKNKYTAKALINADYVLNLISCDLFGLTFFESQKSIFQHAQYKYEKFINCLTLGGAFEQDTLEMSHILQANHIIPYSKKAAENINRGLAFGEIPDKKYRLAIRQIAEEIIGEPYSGPDDEELTKNNRR